MKKIHLVPLIAGAYAALLGIGLIVIGIFDSQGAIVPLRLLGGLVMAGLGALGIWDGIRDLFEPKKKPGHHTPSDQYIFIDTEGKRSARVGSGELRAQIETLAEKGGESKISLQILPPRPIPGIGHLEQVLCTSGGYEKPLCLIAILQAESGMKTTCLKEADLHQAVDCFERLMAGGTEDFSNWTPAILRRNTAGDGNQANQRLTLFCEERREDYRFFTGRDLELAINGLADGKYRRVELAFPFVAFHAFLSQEEGCITLRLILFQDGDQRAFEKDGTATQVKFWLIQMINNDMPEQLYGWKEISLPKNRGKQRNE